MMALAIEAAKLRATVGEISDALEAEFGRYTPNSKMVPSHIVNDLACLFI